MVNHATPDEISLKLTQAIRVYDLDQLASLVKDEVHWPMNQFRSNLRFVFEAAANDHINLLFPPPDFQHWLRGPLRRTIKGEETASNSTINARLSTLSMLYELLIDRGLILQHPLRKLERPANIKTPHTPPPADELERLLAHAHADVALHAALLLLTHHALFVTELLTLRWPHFHHPSGTLLRKNGTLQLDAATYRALDQLLAVAGGPLAQPQGKIFPYQNLDALRTRLFQVCQQANLPFIGPARLRKVALTGQFLPATATQPQEEATALAENVARKLAGGKGS